MSSTRENAIGKLRTELYQKKLSKLLPELKGQKFITDLKMEILIYLSKVLQKI